MTPTAPQRETRTDVLKRAIEADTEDDARRLLSTFAEANHYKPGWVERLMPWVCKHREDSDGEG